jgi:flagellar motility protein MotE (MotC chaperone)
LDVGLLWALSAQLPEIWDEVKDVVARVRRILSQHQTKVDQMIKGYLKAKADSSAKFSSRYN